MKLSGPDSNPMKKIVISQPMLFPWRGIFEQIKLCDVFVYYDDVQLPKGGGKGRGFITRVQLKKRDGSRQWLTVPVKRPTGSYLMINEAVFSDQKWRKKHLGSIRDNYRKAPHFEEIYEVLIQQIYGLETDKLNEFLIFSMDRIMEYIGLNRKKFRSSLLNIGKDIGQSERVLAHCKHFGAHTYISGHGAKNYIDYSLFEKHDVQIFYMDYALSEYPQINGAFTPYVSILDLLFNVGSDAMHYLCSPAMYWKKCIDRVENQTA